MSIWHIEEYKPRAPRGSSALEAAYVWQNDRQLPDLQAGFRGISSDQQPYPLPSYLFLENAARLPKVDPHAWGPEYEQVILNREDHNEGYQTTMDVKSLRQIPVSMDGVPQGGLPQEMEESEVDRKKREREMIQQSQQKAERNRQKRQKKEFGQEQEGRRQMMKEEEGFGMEEMFKEEGITEEGMKEEEKKPEAFFFDPSPIMNELKVMIDEMKTKNEGLKQSLMQDLEQMKQLPIKNRKDIETIENYVSKFKSQVASYVQGQDQGVKDELNQKIEKLEQKLEQQLSQSMQQAGKERQQMKQEMGQMSQQINEMDSVMGKYVEDIARELQRQDLTTVEAIQMQKQILELFEQLRQNYAQYPAEELQQRLNQVEAFLQQLEQRIKRGEKQKIVVKIVRPKNPYSSGFQKTMTSVGANTESKEAFVPITQSFFSNEAYSLQEEKQDVPMLTPSPLQSPAKPKTPSIIRNLGSEARNLYQSGKKSSPLQTRGQRKKSK
jgi:hypothetical protein